MFSCVNPALASGRLRTPPKRFTASMDENPGIPEAHFDLVVSIYSLGWTPDLGRTLSMVFSYLKPVVEFIFNWKHPVYQCLNYRDDIGNFVFTHPYLKEGPEIDPSWKGVEIVLYPRTLSIYQMLSFSQAWCWRK